MVSRVKLLQGLGDAATALLPKEMRRRARTRIRAHFKVGVARAGDVIVLSRAKSGRTWLRAMLSRLYQKRYGLPETELLESDNFHRAVPAIPIFAFVHGQGLDEVLEADPSPAWMAGKKIIFLVRNPLDVAVSEYFQSTRRASAGKREMMGVEDDMPMFDFVMEGPNGLRAIIPFMNGWQRRVAALGIPALTLRYEDLRADPHAGLRRISEFIGAAFTEEEIDDAVEQNTIENLREKERTNFYQNKRLAPRDPNDPDSYKVRRGKVGGYRDYFEPAQIAAMEAYVAARLSPTFGYGATHDTGEAAPGDVAPGDVAHGAPAAGQA